MSGIRKWNLRVLRWALLPICLLCMLQPSAATAATETAPKTLTAIIRNRASESGYPIGQMINGTKLHILQEKKNYYKIDCYDMNGYIRKSQVKLVDGAYFVSCQEGEKDTGSIVSSDHNTVISQRRNILELSRKLRGDRYVYGGNRPGGFDCSGFTSYVMNRQGFGIHRTASTQLQDGVIIPKEALQVGDLVFFKRSGSSYPATHVGIYVGDNNMIHSARHGVVLESLESSYYAKNYLCARRVLHADPAVGVAMPKQRSETLGLTVNSITGRTVHGCN